MGLHEHSGTMTVAAPTMRICVHRSYVGFALACFSGVIGLATIMFAPANSPLALFTLVLLPLALAFLLTGQFIDALTLVWINEMLFGGTGHWIEFGPISGRWILLVLLVLLGAAQTLLLYKKRNRENWLKPPLFTRMIVIYGVFFPLWLVFYSVVSQGTPFWKAISDINFLYVLLAYFPLRQFILRHFNLFRGWIVGAVLVLGGLFLFLALAPPQLAISMFRGLVAHEIGLGAASGINRAALGTQVILFIGVFLGGLYAVDTQQRNLNRFAGFVLCSISIAPFILMFLRGPLLSLAGVILMFVLAASQRGKISPIAIRLLFGLVFFSVIAFTLYSLFVPEGLERFTRGNRGGLSTFVSEVRIEQADRMLAAFREKPILGQGVGVPISNYSRTEEYEGLSFELQYHMLLYRMGLVAFALLLVPVLQFFLEPFRILRHERAVLFRHDGKFMLVVLLSLLTTLVAGALNPYLTAIYTPFFVILYLSCKEFIIWQGAYMMED